MSFNSPYIADNGQTWRLLPIAARIDYHCAAMSSGTEYRRALVAAQFHRARRRAALEALLSRFSGQTADLLSFGEVVDKLGMSGQSSLGVRQIPIDAIVGSVGRYQDFTRTFLPRHESDEDRWVRVGAAAPTVADLPPIEVYKIGDAYFGYGDYAKAISLYRAALQKGGIDANVVNTHLAMALALSGQKAEAEAALKAVTGPRAELANFMLVWLGQQA